MKELWVPLSGAIAQQRKVDTIANNIANINTTGFKKDRITFKEYLTTFEKGYNDINLPKKEWRPKDFYHSYGAEHSQVKADASYTIHDQGQLSPTNNPLDIGLRGKGFFEVLTPNGVRYTRKGIFSIREDGPLITDQGYHLLGKGTSNPESRKIIIPSTIKKIVVSIGGELFVDDKSLGKVSVIEFNDLHSLRKEGNSLFINQNANNIKSIISTTTHQGFTENSNVNAVLEMSELIKAHRHFEAIQNVIKTYDQTSSKGINEIGKF